jgi:hypothetical protein
VWLICGATWSTDGLAACPVIPNRASCKGHHAASSPGTATTSTIMLVGQFADPDQLLENEPHLRSGRSAGAEDVSTVERQLRVA